MSEIRSLTSTFDAEVIGCHIEEKPRAEVIQVLGRRYSSRCANS